MVHRFLLLALITKQLLVLNTPKQLFFQTERHIQIFMFLNQVCTNIVFVLTESNFTKREKKNSCFISIICNDYDKSPYLLQFYFVCKAIPSGSNNAGFLFFNSCTEVVTLSPKAKSFFFLLEQKSLYIKTGLKVN